MPTDVTATQRSRTGGAIPRRAPQGVRIAGWVSLIAEVLIVGTGGAVRLTGSGLGCHWPLCAPDSLFPLPGMSLHSYIEFGNRMMTGVVGLAALAVLILVWRLRRERRDLFTLAWIVVGGVLLQALMGGITVLADLTAGVVGVHFLISMAMIVVAAAFVARTYTAPGPRTRAVPPWHTGLVHTAAALTVLTLVLGVVTSESGPHSGNADVHHHLFNAMVMAHVHSVPGYALLALSVVLVVTAWRAKLPTLRWSAVLLVLLVLQVPLGVYQARAGLPAVAVGLHMILAAVITAVATALVLRLRIPVASPEAASRVDA